MNKRGTGLTKIHPTLLCCAVIGSQAQAVHAASPAGPAVAVRKFQATGPGDVLAIEQGSVPADQVFEAEQELGLYPARETSGQFAYTAQYVGGATGSGSGTSQILPGEGKAKTIKRSGSGAIQRPLGTFSAAISESLNLTPVATCGRTGNR